jgi:hypothetical protein
MVYKSLFRHVLAYASPFYGYAAETNTNKLQTFQNKVRKR